MKILQICARIPSPPDDGGAVYVYNITRQLSALGHEVHMASFISELHRQDISDIQRFVTLHTVEGEFTQYGVQAALKSFFSLKPVSISHRMDPEKMGSVFKNINTGFDVILMEGLHTAAFLDAARISFPDTPLVLRQVNVEHRLIQRNAELTASLIKRAFLKHQTSLMRRFEISALQKADAITSISGSDLEFFRHYIPDKPSCVIPPGTPDLDYPSFEKRDDNHLLAISSWKWQPNLDGLSWFLEKCWPSLKKRHNGLVLTIAGAGLPESLSKSLPEGVEHIGFVEDLTPLKQQATLQIVPLISGSGVKLKVMEAISAGIPLVSTPHGTEGTELEDQVHFMCAETAAAFADSITKLLSDKPLRKRLSENAYALAREKYSWEKQARKLEHFLNALIS